MYEIVAAVVLGAFVLGITLAAVRAREVFRIRFQHGRVQQVRGSIRDQTVQELVDVLERARIRQALIRGVRQQGQTRLVVRGVSPPVEQRLRNTFAAAR